ncbi:MAG: methyltransferase domain-containing protein [bacterium]|nr:methyltransferase domain-containing protein [bacterium]
MPTQFPPEYFTKQDTSDDAFFYAQPRKVVHIDDGAIRALTDQFARLLPPNGAILDLMSSWRSHLPSGMRFSEVVGLGMNADEMRDNGQLSEVIVQNLNKHPQLPFADGRFDAAVCTVSVQYLQRPLDVFADVYRVLKPGGIFIVSFSNRCFPTKAVNVWLSLTDNQHIALVSRYFEESGAWMDLQAVRKEGSRSLFAAADPLYIVHARKLAPQPHTDQP